LLQSR